MDVRTLQKDGFVVVKYPATLREEVRAAMTSWAAFCQLPMDTKKTLSGGDRIRDFGYMLRADTGPNSESKEQFHVSRNQIEHLRHIALGIKKTSALIFIEAADRMLLGTSKIIQNFAAGVSQVYNLPGFEADVMSSVDRWTFRYLHYFGGETLAFPHADRGGFTLHLYEDLEGGDYLGFDGVWRAWPVTSTQTIIFPSMGLQLRSENRLKALWHRVRSTGESAKRGRFSMVAFIDFKQPYRYNDAKKRMQDFPPGFNYQISKEEFESLFVPR